MQSIFDRRIAQMQSEEKKKKQATAFYERQKKFKEKGKTK